MRASPRRTRARMAARSTNNQTLCEAGRAWSVSTTRRLSGGVPAYRCGHQSGSGVHGHQPATLTDLHSGGVLCFEGVADGPGGGELARGGGVVGHKGNRAREQVVGPALRVARHELDDEHNSLRQATEHKMEPCTRRVAARVRWVRVVWRTVTMRATPATSRALQPSPRNTDEMTELAMTATQPREATTEDGVFGSPYATRF